MPWKVVKQGKKFVVKNSNTGKTAKGGTHNTREKAERHMRALFANTTEEERQS